MSQDPIDRARHEADVIEQHRAAQHAAGIRRREAIAEARQTMSAQQIADELGVSKARVYRILSGKET